MFKKPVNELEDSDKALRTNLPFVPNNLWVKCPSCKNMVLSSDLEESLRVCPKCQHHFRLTARQRIAYTVDKDTFVEHDKGMVSKNPLDFPEYSKKLKNARLQSGENESVICGTAKIEGKGCALCVMDSSFMMGSMGTVTGEKVTRLFEYATRAHMPVIAFTVSGGARMQEGILSLMQMAKTSAAVKRHNDAGLLYITVLTDPTTGGVTASFAMEGDIILAEPKALIGFAGPRVIEQTIRQHLPQGFQRSEFLLEKGFVDAIVPRKDLRGTLGKLLTLHEEAAQ
ncbi:MAG TPA: acetyl-CoA carboxylase carboxyltransferase subunit beta [Candidatus Gallacutalibacter stercoravium]|nr:acetyl-CoA carboxylase carboxyltransferase subunit beta [Candidatus Gallacutalibacter stercoravium]